VTVDWVRDKEQLFTKFAEFDAGACTMVQLQNNAEPHEFRRSE